MKIFFCDLYRQMFYVGIYIIISEVKRVMIAVYADVLVGINVLITYIFLVCTRVAGNMPTNKWGVCIASVLGGLSSLVIFAGNIGVTLSVLYKIFTASVIVGIGFLPDSIRKFIKVLLLFFGISIAFGGAMYFAEITFNPKGIMYLNGTVYFDMDIKYLVGCTFLIYGAFLGTDALLQRKASKSEIYDVSVTFRGITVTLSGYVDTGNNLADFLTGKKAFVGELKALSALFTYEEIKYFKGGNFENIPESLIGKIRLIPCKTVGDATLLPSFTPDEIQIQLRKKKIKSVDFCVAISDNSLSDGEYNILLNKAIYEY